jgi:hypothetical protein
MNTAPVNQPHAGESTQDFHERIWSQYPPDKTAPAVAAVRAWLQTSETYEKLQAWVKADPKEWWFIHHFFGGMQTRNYLRQHGFGEDYWPVWNLDDLWVKIIEEAVRE